MNIFDRINKWIEDVEYSVVNVISSIAPWLAPLAPAYLSYFHMRNILEFPVWVSLSIAGVVEMLGLSTISTFLEFWNHNRHYSADKNKVPVLIPVFSFFFYLGIVLTVNVMLEVSPNGNAPIMAKAFLTLLTVPAAATLAVRVMHRDIRDGLKKPLKSHENKIPEISGNLPRSADWRTVPHQDRMKISTMTPKMISQGYAVSERTARNWKENALEYAQEFVYGEKE